MTVRKIILILGLFSLGLPNLAYADEGAPVSNAELDKLCNYLEEAFVIEGSFGIWRLPENCDYLDPGFLRETNYGHQEKLLFDVLLVDFLLDYLVAYDPPQEDLANFWVWDMRSDFRAREFENLLRQYSVNQDVIDEFRDLRDRFTLLERDRDLVLYHAGFSQKEREELVYSAEEQIMGLSESLKALLNKIFSNNSSSSSLTFEFKEKIEELLEMNLDEKRKVKKSEDELLGRMGLSIFEDTQFEDTQFYEKIQICQIQKQRVREAWTNFGADFSLWEPSPELVLNSQSYQFFAKEEKAFDDCVLSMFQATFGDEGMTFMINSTFALGPAFVRSKKRLNGMEYLLFIEAMIRAIDQFSAAQKWQWRPNHDTQEWWQSNVDVLTGAWQTMVDNASESPGGGHVLLYFVPPANSEGRFEPRFAGWLIGRWLARSDIDELIDQGRVVTFEGDFYLLPPTYAFRTINSADRLQRFKAMRILEVVLK